MLNNNKYQLLESIYTYKKNIDIAQCKFHKFMLNLSYYLILPLLLWNSGKMLFGVCHKIVYYYVKRHNTSNQKNNNKQFFYLILYYLKNTTY